jgi:hypothetical protein
MHLIQAAAKDNNSPLYAVLLDVAKAFDSLDHCHLLDIMMDMGYDAEDIEVVRRLLIGSSTCIGRVRRPPAPGCPAR